MSCFWRITLALIGLMLLMPILFGIDSGLRPDTPWTGQVNEVPLWLKAWLSWIVFPIFIVSLAFLHRSNGARLAAAGIILSHVPMFVHMFDVTVGVVGILHLLFWSPALIVLAKERSTLELRTFYGVWVHLILFVLAVSLAFDFRDALRFIFF